MNDFIIDAMTDRLWEIAQGRYGARSMRAVLENPNVTLSQQVCGVALIEKTALLTRYVFSAELRPQSS